MGRISIQEIENAIYDHAAMAKCAVSGVSDMKWGEVPIAYVIVRAAATIAERDLIDHRAIHLACFRRPCM
ncbi:AMP-binding enzyme [Inquilinus limosus]|uniref:AMP-binding enzyme n=1 Tax=Inquilinus limosus TaxID=171674 RepID=UPI003F5CDECA